MPKLTIGRVATAAGVNVETVRYYQRRGLLEEPVTPPRGYRNYPTQMVKRIRFIRARKIDKIFDTFPRSKKRRPWKVQSLWPFRSITGITTV
jgi:predicted site-specific integrase-resolvase